MPRISLSWALASPAIALCLACSANRKEALEHTVKSYVRALKDRNETLAVAHVEPTKRDEFFKNSKILEQLEISQIDVRSIYPDEKMQNAIVHFNMEYFSQQDANLVSSRRTLNWKYDEGSKAWLLEEITPFGLSRGQP